MNNTLTPTQQHWAICACEAANNGFYHIARAYAILIKLDMGMTYEEAEKSL